jgi:glycosyltransferase involved in cell wall biosynthesis
MKCEMVTCWKKFIMYDKSNLYPVVSVVIPNFNYASFLPKCIDSILCQDYPRIEVIVVDDGSTDHSVRVLDEYAGKIKIIHSSNNGVNHARNLGLFESHGEFVAFCDSDDWWETTKISSQIQLFNSNPDLSLVYCGIKITNGEPSHDSILVPKFRGRVVDSILRYPASAIVLLGASTALIRRSYLDIHSISWNENLKLPGEDINFFSKIALDSTIDFVDAPMVMYRQHSNSRSKMSVSATVIGNRESFRDFAQFAVNTIPNFQLKISWFRLNLGLIKFVIKKKHWLFLASQVKYFFQFYLRTR